LLLRKSGNAGIQAGQTGHFLAAEHVDMLEVPDTLDRSLGDVHASGNPHIHTDPRNIARVASKLYQRLVEIDPVDADIYGKRYEKFERDWQGSINKWSKQAAVVNSANVVVHHDYWSYLIKWLGLNKIATLEPVPGVSPTTRHLSRVKQLLKSNKAVMIIDTNYMNDRPVKWLAEQTNLPVVTLPATVDYQGGETLHQWFDNLVGLVQEPVK
jgi:zinc/manganese transport system substrate-binding protein